MVRVGGGWCALDEFLVKNDPCRGKLAPTARQLGKEMTKITQNRFLRFRIDNFTEYYRISKISGKVLDVEG
jgi:hypothetical protein